MRRLILAFSLIGNILQAQELKQFSLFDCQKKARESHPYYQDRQRIETSAGLKNRNINTQWLPQINANAQASYQSDVTSIPITMPGIKKMPYDQYTFWFDLNQMIFDGGSISAQKHINETSSQAELLQNESELHKITEQVNQTYFGLLLTRENLILLQNVKDNLEQRRKSVDAATQNGLLQESDLKNINIEILKNRQQIDELSLSYSAGINILSELTGEILPDSAVLEIPDVRLSDTGSVQRAEIKAFNTQKTVLSYNDKLSLSQRLPKIYAFSQAGYGRPGLDMLKVDFKTYYIVGITLKWNLWDWNKTSRDRQTLVLQSEMFDSKKSAFEKNLNIMLQTSKSRICQLEKSLQTDSAIVDLRTSVTKLSAVKLEQGTMTATDYINDLNGETQSRIQMKTHVIQLVQEKINYLTIKGIL
jgi:outer membrane protein TolC